MKKAIKLLSLAMLFAMPLAACGNNNNGGNSGNNGGNQSGEHGDSGDEGGGSGSGSGGGQHSGDEGGGSGSGGGGQEVGSTVTLDFSELSGISGKVGAVSYACDKNGGASDPVIGGDHDLRLYAKGTFTLSSSSNMTKAVFEISKKGLTRLADISVNTGTVSYSSDNSVVTWTGNASKVVFTVGDKATHGTDGSTKAGQFDFYSVAVTLGEGGGSSDEGGGGGGGSHVADLESYAKEISYNVFEEEDGYELLEDGSYYVGVYWDEEGAMSLVEACEDAYNYTPEDFVLANDPEEDGDMAYMICATEDESVYIEIDSYLEDDDAGDTWICIDYFIYEAE